MDTKERRKAILEILNSLEKPVKGTEIAEKFGVSRQVIVQDVAVLRAKGEDILATPRGYLIPKAYESNKIIRTIVCKHDNDKEIEEELDIILSYGGKIIDVSVEHPLYGEIKSQLQISSRYDLNEFMVNLKKYKAEALSSLTDGIHIHKIEVDNEEMLIKIKEKLLEKKYLIKED